MSAFAIAIRKFDLRGQSRQMPYFPQVLVLFLQYLYEISFNPKTLQQGRSASSNKCVRIFSRLLKGNVKKKKAGGGQINEF